MTPEELFTVILENKREGELFPLFRSLDNKQRKSLAPVIKKLAKHYLSYQEIKKPGEQYSRYEQIATPEQYNILAFGSFFCFSEADFKKTFYAGTLLDRNKLVPVLEWFVPDWFDSYINSFGKTDYVPYQLNYDWLMELFKKGLVVPQKELLVKLIPGIPFERKENNQWVCKPENLLKYPETISEHIWHLFEVESNIHYSDRYLTFANEQVKELSGWVPIFKNFAATGHMERKRLLQESILASNKNFNKILSGWFADLFVALEPQKNELLGLQKELFTVLNSPHSKPVNTVLQQAKKIIPEKEFDIITFLDTVPALLASTAKNVVATTLMILENIARKKKEYCTQIARLCCQVFVQTDDELQVRAAKIIEKFADKTDEKLRTELNAFQPVLLQNARKILVDFLDTKITDGSSHINFPVIEIVQAEERLQPIPLVETTDDLLFLASQAFDNNESWHFDMLPAALVNLQDQLTGPVLPQLQSALQRALQTCRNGLRSTTGFYDHMLALFFIDVCVYLVRKYPSDAAVLNDVFENFTQQDGNITRKWMKIGPHSSYVSSWDNYYHDPYYLPCKQFLMEALEKIRQGDKLPLLSTPTHLPGWIDAEVLVERIYLYQQQGAYAEAWDGQLALSRCYLKNAGTAIALAKQKLQGEWLHLMLFLLQEETEPTGEITQASAWMIASLCLPHKKKYAALENSGYYENSFEKYTGQLGWRSMVEEYETDRYDYKLQKSVRVKDTRKILKIDFPQLRKKQETTGVQKILNKLWNKQKTKELAPLIYDYLSIKAQYFSHEHNDIRRAFLMVPNNPEAFLPEILYHSLKYPTFMGENDKRMVIAVLQLLHENWESHGEMAHLFLATSLLSSDKTAANFAAEIWLKNAPLGKINNVMLGKIIGLHESIEFAPLKRLTDLIMQSLFNVSPTHNKMAHTVLENMLPELPATPIKNLRKLLEIFSELCGNDAQMFCTPITEKLSVWKETASLKTITETLLKKSNIVR